MGKNDAKNRTNQMLDDRMNASNAEHNSFMADIGTRKVGAKDREKKQYDTLWGGWNDFASGKHSYDRSLLDRSGRNRSWAVFDDLSKGGLGAEEINRIRGNGVFDEFSKTGGYSAGDISNIRQRGTSTIPAYYAAARDEASRQAAIQGGYGMGQQALMAQLSRNAAQSGQKAALDTEIGIKEGVNKGRQWGTEGMSAAELDLGRITSSNKQAAGVGFGNIYESDRLQENFVQDFDKRNISKGLEGIHNLRTTYSGELSHLDEMEIASRKLANEGIYGGQELYIKNNPQRDWYATIAQMIGAGGSAMDTYSKFAKLGSGKDNGAAKPEAGSPGSGLNKNGTIATTDYSSNYYNNPQAWNAPSYKGNMQGGELTGDVPTVNAWAFDKNGKLIPNQQTPPTTTGLGARTPYGYTPTYGGSYNDAYKSMQGYGPGSAGSYAVPYGGNSGYSNYGLSPYSGGTPPGGSGGGGGFEVRGFNPMYGYIQPSR
jgi:hypothetical protein